MADIASPRPAPGIRPGARAGRWLALLALSGLAACASTPRPSPPVAPPPAPAVATAPAAPPVVTPAAPAMPVEPPAPAPPVEPAVVPLAIEPGLYRCELGRRVIVRRISPDGRNLVIGWQGKDWPLDAVEARTGARRFENTRAGLVWLVIVGKSMLLDARAGRTLANECRL
ncbi:MAG: hypothetical protein KGQ67_05930 [Betaproteobacteria bacterium]|nr:hypothetical protein [Betaproteobacteria bacterium]